MISFLEFRAFFIGSIFLLYCLHCNENPKKGGMENLFYLLMDKETSTTPKIICPNQWKFSTVYLANKVKEAPGGTGDGFKDPNKAINGICGAGKTAGSLDVYSLQSSSSSVYCKPNEKCIVLEWKNKKVLNTSEIDFVVFENPFCKGNESNCDTSRFMEPVVVEVSRDGTKWCGWNPQYTGSDNSSTNLQNPNHWQRFAGIEPVLFNQEKWQLSENEIFDKTKAGGDGFDLSDSNFGNSGDGCDSTEKSEIQTNGFLYLRLTSAVSRGFPYPSDSFDQTADIDGVVAKNITDR